MKLYRIKSNGFLFKSKEDAVKVLTTILEAMPLRERERSVEKPVEKDKDGWRGYTYYTIGFESESLSLEEVEINLKTEEEVDKLREESEKKIAKLEKSGK